MTIKNGLLICTALVGFGTLAQAQTLPSGGVTQAAIEAAYSEFERIEIKFGPSQIKVEAVDAETGQKVETIYDRATGTILKQERYSVSGAVGSGLETKSTTGDFVRVDDDSNSSSDDDGVDDTTGSDDDGDDSSGSDDNGNDSSGSDDDGNDSSGSDDNNSGSDDNGNDSSGSDDDSDDSSGGNDNSGGNSGRGGSGGNDSSGGNDD